jgi:hypothetical protein
MKAINVVFITLIGLSTLSLAPPASARLVDCEVNGKSVDPNNGGTTNGVTGLLRGNRRLSMVIMSV